MTLVLAAGGAAQPVPPASLDDVVLFARSEAKINHSVRQASGHIVVNEPTGRLRVSPRFTVVPDLEPQIVANEIEVLTKSSLGPELFDVFVNTIDDPNGGLSAAGTLTMPMGFGLPLLPYPSTPVVTPGEDSLRITRADSPYTIPPGNYDRVRLGPEALVYLEGGTYNIRILRVATRGQLLANGPTTLNVADRVRFGARANFGPAESELNGRCIVLNTSATRVSFGRQSDVSAIVNAPAARMKLGRLANFRGTFTADRIIVGFTTILESLPPLMEPCS